MRLSPLGLKASLLGDGDSARGLGSGLALSGAPATGAEVPPPRLHPRTGADGRAAQGRVGGWLPGP